MTTSHVNAISRPTPSKPPQDTCLAVWVNEHGHYSVFQATFRHGCREAVNDMFVDPADLT